MKIVQKNNKDKYMPLLFLVWTIAIMFFFVYHLLCKNKFCLLGELLW